MKIRDILIFSLLLPLVSCGCRRDRSLSRELLSSLDTSEFVASPRFLSESINSVSLDSVRASSLDTTCTYFVASGVRTDQKNSGRCWLFSTLNVLRADMIGKYNLDDFEFSETYCQFYDVLEKSNRCFETIIDHRRESIHSRANDWVFRKPIGDGGHFTNATNLIDKYGLVPQSVMPERYSSTDNAELMKLVRKLIRRYGLRLREAPKRELQNIKEEGLADIRRVLAACLGEPPAEFEWTMTDRNGGIVASGTYTPASFRDSFVGEDVGGSFVCFMNNPTIPYYRMYEVEDSRNCIDCPVWTFLNVPMQDINEMAVSSLAAGRMCLISADTDHDALTAEGVYDADIYRVDTLLGISSAMTKEELASSCEISSVHAMAVAGVRIDSTGQVLKYVIENSFGTSRGWDGYVVMTSDWFDRYLWRFAVAKEFVPERLLRLVDGKAKIIPLWNPTY